MQTNRNKINQIPPSISNTCTIITTFNPDSNFIERLYFIIKQFEYTIIIDNNSSKDFIDKLKNVNFNNVHIIYNNKNFGIATALNIAIKYGIERGYIWAFILDQDTIPYNNILNCFIEKYIKYNGNTKIAVIGCNSININSGRPLIKINKKTNIDILIEKKSVITSGSLISLEIFEEIGGFLDYLFIDSVDHEYCLRARRKNYNVLFLTKPLMKHSVGNESYHHFLGIKYIKIYTSNHSPLRRYYMARNTLIIFKKYFSLYPFWLMHKLLDLFISFLKIYLFENSRKEKMKLFIAGLLDGIFSSDSRKPKPHDDDTGINT